MGYALRATTVFAKAAEADRRLAERLESAGGEQVLFLHGRRGGRAGGVADIEHVAVTPSGVYVIGARHFRGAKVRVRRTGGLRRPVDEQLMIRGEDGTHLVDDLTGQFIAVVEAVSPVEAPVTAVLCFVDADLPMMKTSVHCIPVMSPRELGRVLRRPGPLDAQQREALWERLARELPPV